MQLLEFFTELDQTRINPEKDVTEYTVDDTRKSRLTLEMINELRHTIQARRQEKSKSIEMYQKMYGGSVADAAAPAV
jgi:hypothetical protein